MSDAATSEPEKKPEDEPKADEPKEEDDGEEEEEEEEYVIERILKQKLIAGETQYLVKWRGYDNADDNTWETAENLEDTLALEVWMAQKAPVDVPKKRKRSADDSDDDDDNEDDDEYNPDDDDDDDGAAEDSGSDDDAPKRRRGRPSGSSGGGGGGGSRSPAKKAMSAEDEAQLRATYDGAEKGALVDLLIKIAKAHPKIAKEMSV
jgi:hypothetical protein